MASASRVRPPDVAPARRAEALLARDVTLAHLDEGAIAALAVLTTASVDVALCGFADAESAARRLDRSGPGSIVVTDECCALSVGSAGGPADVVWSRDDRAPPFETWWFDRRWAEGVNPGQVLVLDGGDPATLTRALTTQLDLRRRGALPEPAPQPGWEIELTSDSDHGMQLVWATLLALGSGTVATVGGLDTDPEPPHFVLAAGAYGTGPDDLVRPLPGPSWTIVRTNPDGAPRRWRLDLRTGVLTSERLGDRARWVRFASLARPDVGVLRAEHPTAEPPGAQGWAAPLRPPDCPTALSAINSYRSGVSGDIAWAETLGDRAVVVAAAVQRTDDRRLDRVTAIRAGPIEHHGRLRDVARASAERADAAGFDDLLTEHRMAWAARWDAADIEIGGDRAAQVAVRYALFHLLSCAADGGEAAVGARGLTGLAYAGHVFWDTDVFVLPALAATLPGAARAVLEYRIRRLPAARARAAARGLPGALFPWESADTGADVTPASYRDLDGRIVPILTGSQAEHITSDVAWAALHYVDWTGDTALLSGDGADLVLETARYWAARIRTDAAGRGHIDGVIGPDEYHVTVDDNAYTNQLVRWHLRRAAALTTAFGHPAEGRRFTALADSLADGFDPETGRHEQFTGFSRLDSLLIDEVAEPPVAADVLLGVDRVRRSQVVKQPDVLMLHHLLPEEPAADSLTADLDFYLPRTAHGSSLSPAICAGLLARAGRPDAGMDLFDIACRLDLDNLTGTASGGLHLATMGGLWQAVVHGFAGIRATAEGLRIDPHLPSRWPSLTIRLRYRGASLKVAITGDTVTVDADRPVPVVVGGHALIAPVTGRLTDRSPAEESR